MSRRTYLLVPVLALEGRGRRRPHEAWEAFSGAVGRTGPGGESSGTDAAEQGM